jgi:Arc/MetJ family transcription regulator
MCKKSNIFVYRKEVIQMRTNVEIDDTLIKQAMALTDSKTKKEVVDLALRELVYQRKRRSILQYRGKMKWKGDLNKMRETG